MMRMMGRRKSCAISSAIRGLAEIEASAEPPRTVKSSPTTTTVRPSTLPRPNTQFAGVRCLSSPCSSYSPMPDTAPISWKELASTILSMRSRTVSRPWSRCRLTFSTPPISRANASRRASSSSSGFQIIRLLRLDDRFVGPYRNRLSIQPVVERYRLRRLRAARRPQHPTRSSAEPPPGATASRQTSPTTVRSSPRRRSGIAATTSGTASPLMCGLQRPQATT